MDGGYIVVLVDDTVIECLTDCTLNLSADETDITCKNTSGNRSTRRGAKSATIDFTMNYKEDGSGSKFAALFLLYNNGTAAEVIFGSQQTGDHIYTAAVAYLNSLSVSAPNTGGIVTASGTFTVSGGVTQGTVA